MYYNGDPSKSACSSKSVCVSIVCTVCALVCLCVFSVSSLGIPLGSSALTAAAACVCVCVLFRDVYTIQLFLRCERARGARARVFPRDVESRTPPECPPPHPKLLSSRSRPQYAPRLRALSPQPSAEECSAIDS